MIDRFEVFDTFTSYYSNGYNGYQSYYALGSTRVKIKSVIDTQWVPNDDNSDYMFSYVSNQHNDELRRNQWTVESRTAEQFK